MTFDKNKYDQEFKKINYQRIHLMINKKNIDLINFLNSKKNKTEYILNLIKNDMKKEKGEWIPFKVNKASQAFLLYNQAKWDDCFFILSFLKTKIN